MCKPLNLSGERFGRLTALTAVIVDGKRKWACVCDCGNTVNVDTHKLMCGHTKSCGCLKRERTSQASRKDYSGQRFGRLTVIECTSSIGKPVMYKCRCDCGKYTEILGSNLATGSTKSCGCLRSETTTQRYTKHGGSNDRLYRTWQNMKHRCLNPKNKEYHRYGGRGITVCPEWITDFAAFRDWAMTAGYTDEMQIDRINVNKGYEPTNCQWLTPHDHSIKSNHERKEGHQCPESYPATGNSLRTF